MELYGYDLSSTVRQRKMATVKKVQEMEGRLTRIETSLESILEQLKLLEKLESRITERERKCECKISVDTGNEASKQEISSNNEDVLSRVAVCEMTTDDRISKLETLITEVGDQTVALGVRFEEFKAEFPTPAEVRSSDGSPVKEMTVVSNRDSCGDLLKTTRDSVLVLGDSMARGVGVKLRCQGGSF